MIQQSQRFVFPEYSEFTQINETRAVVSTPTSKKDVSGESVPIVKEILSHLRDSSTPSELADTLDMSDDEVTELLEYLLEKEIIFVESGQFQQDIFDWISGQPQQAREQVEAAKIGVISPASAPLYPTLETLEAHTSLQSFSSMDEIPNDLNLLVTVANNERPDWHLTLLEEAFTNSFELLPGRLIGTQLRVGPLTIPDFSPCYHCFYTRLQASTSESVALHETLDGRTTPRETASAPRFLQKQLESLLEREVMYSLLDGKTAISNGAYIKQNMQSAAFESHDVFKIPGCDTCGTN